MTAHGASDERRRAWREAGFQVHDTTCPLVRRAHGQLAALVAAGYFPVVIGQAGHTEVRGLTGDFPGAAVVESEADLPALPDHPRYGVIAQTTQPADKVRRLVGAVARRETRGGGVFPRHGLRRRPGTARNRCASCSGRRRSSSSWAVAPATTPGSSCSPPKRPGGAPTQIERPEELDPGWLAGAGTVGLTAGTSTLPETVRAVHARLEAIAGPGHPLNHHHPTCPCALLSSRRAAEAARAAPPRPVAICACSGGRCPGVSPRCSMLAVHASRVPHASGSSFFCWCASR